MCEDSFRAARLVYYGGHAQLDARDHEKPKKVLRYLKCHLSPFGDWTMSVHDNLHLLQF